VKTTGKGMVQTQKGREKKQSQKERRNKESEVKLKNWSKLGITRHTKLHREKKMRGGRLGIKKKRQKKQKKKQKKKK